MPRLSVTCALLLLAAGVATSGAFTNFESGHVRPLAISPDGAWLFAVNTPDGRLAVYALGPSGDTLAAEVPVGLEPVAVAARINPGGRPEAWVVNHLSDSVSVVEIDPVEPARSRVTRTLLVGDEPRDVVFAGTSVTFGDQVRGFGFLHNGVATIFQFLNAPRFTFGSDPNVDRRNVEEFILSLDTGLAPIVGQQLTVGAAPDAAVADRLALLLARADAGECDVVVKGIVDGVARGALYAGSGVFLPDRTGEPPLSTAALVTLAAAPGQEQTFTAVPPGDGPRAAIDRDEDGVLDADERDAGASPTDAASVPGGPAFTLVPTTKLVLRDGRRRRLAFASRTRGGSVASRIVPPAPGSPGDPSLRGATLVFYDAAGSGEADLLTIKSGRAGLAYSLDEPHQGRIAVRLVLGTATVLCAEARARTSGTPPSPARFDRTGRFTGAPRTPPPPACPQVPVAG